MGETSGSAIRTLSLGKPLVVSDLGWFAELPDEVALKVPVGGDGEVDGARRARSTRLAEPGVAARMGEAARALRRAREHDLDRVAEQYVAALEQAAGSGAVEAKIAAARSPRRRRTRASTRARSRRSSRRSGSSSRERPRPGARHAGGSACCAPARCGRGSRRSTWSPSPCSSRSACASSRRGSWSTSSSTPTWRAASRDTGHFLIRGVHANYGFVYPLLLSPAYKLFGVDRPTSTSGRA